MSPRYPGAYWRPCGQDLGPNNGPRANAFHTAITTAHTIVGWVESSNACHGYIDVNGAAEQFKDFDRACYGTLDGNYRGVVTWESWDGLPVATATEWDVNQGSWTPQMCERIADIIAFGDIELDIPPYRMHGTNDKGNGGHCTGISNRTSGMGINLYEGPGRWSSSTSKPCPGDHRIIQLYGPNLDGGSGSIMERGRSIAAAIRAGQCSYLPQGDVDLSSALQRGSGTPVVQWSILNFILGKV